MAGVGRKSDAVEKIAALCRIDVLSDPRLAVVITTLSMS